MLGGVGNHNAGNNVAVAGDSAATGAASGAGGLLNTEKDQKASSTEAKFGDVLNMVQSKYGAKPEKQREIKKTLGKDDFLRIMITQLKNQDPTSPFKAEQMATEMAQFSSVEQLQNINTNLGKLQNAQTPLERLAMTNMIGKIVTIDKERFQHIEGQNESLSFNLPKDAKEVRVTIVSDAGETVLDKQMGVQKAGEVVVSWDGKKGTTPISAKNGNYQLKVEAKGEKDETIQTNPMSQARVIGVSFEGSEPAFLVGTDKHQDKISMKQIVKVDDQAAASAGGLPTAMTPGSGSSKPNLFSFRKGEGSANIDENANPEIAQAVAKFQADQAADKKVESAQKMAAAVPAEPRNEAPPASEPKPVKAEGFPNGLHDTDEVHRPETEKGGQ